MSDGQRMLETHVLRGLRLSGIKTKVIYEKIKVISVSSDVMFMLFLVSLFSYLEAPLFFSCLKYKSINIEIQK